MFQTCLGSLNTRRTLYTSLRNVDSIVQNNNTALAIATQCSAPALVFQALLGIFEISVLPMAAWTFWSPLKNITEYCMTRCCRMVSRWRTNLLPDFEPTCAMPSVKRIPSDWSAFLGVQFIASYYMDSQLVNLCVIHFYQLLLYHANKTTYNIVVNSPLLHGCPGMCGWDVSAAVWLKGLDPTCATCAGKPHVLLECRLQLHFDSGSGALSLSWPLLCATPCFALV